MSETVEIIEPTQPALTVEKQRPAHLFQPGQSGNPRGRPRGARSRFSERFLGEFARDFAEHGPEVIARVRAETPHYYLRIAASLIPTEMQLEIGRPGDFAALETAEEIVEKIREEMGPKAADLLQQLIDESVNEDGR
jgi:Family of unknown function (DUF5681)